MKIMNVAGFLPLHLTSEFLIVIQRGKVYHERYLPMHKDPRDGTLGSHFGVVVGITDDDFVDEVYELLAENGDCDLVTEELTAPNLHNWK